MNPNWFVAVPAPADPRLAERLRIPAPAGVRPLHPEDLHLTVAFLGPVGEEQARRAWDLRAAWPGAPFRATLVEVVGLGPQRRISVLAALLGAGRAEVEALIAAWRDPMLRAAGAPEEPRAPLAHLTLARLARGASGAERSSALAWARALDLAEARLNLAEIALYTRAEAPGARRFQIVARAPLA